MIIERTQEGKAIAKQREDYREGRPKKFTKAQLDHAMELKKERSFGDDGDFGGYFEAGECEADI